MLDRSPAHHQSWSYMSEQLTVIMALTSGYAVRNCLPGGRQGDWRALHSDSRGLSCSYTG